jgi:hypothetical protein
LSEAFRDSTGKQPLIFNAPIKFLKLTNMTEAEVAEVIAASIPEENPQ